MGPFGKRIVGRELVRRIVLTARSSWDEYLRVDPPIIIAAVPLFSRSRIVAAKSRPNFSGSTSAMWIHPSSRIRSRRIDSTGPGVMCRPSLSATGMRSSRRVGGGGPVNVLPLMGSHRLPFQLGLVRLRNL